jgi:hypothetical protein
MKRLFVLPLLLLAACASGPQLEPADSAEQARAVQTIESITGMKFKGPVSVYYFSPGTIAGEDYSEDSPSGEVIGFYDTEAKRLYLTRKAVDEDWYFGLRIHEATHALQDQHYNLDALDGATTCSDEYLALQALIEGHAECVMAEAMGDAADELIYDVDENGELKSVAAPTETDILHAFEYGVGLRFVRWLKAGGGYRAVDDAFRNPPASTEQVLHADKYLRELPDEIELDMAALQAAMPGWVLGKPDRAGELGVLTLLAVNGDSETASAAASGWGGDVMLDATRGDETVSVWLTTWDTAEDAAEFRHALGKVAGASWSFEAVEPRVVTVILGDDVDRRQVTAALRKSKIAYHVEG